MNKIKQNGLRSLRLKMNGLSDSLLPSRSKAFSVKALLSHLPTFSPSHSFFHSFFQHHVAVADGSMVALQEYRTGLRIVG